MVNHRHLLFIVEHLQDSLDCSFEEKSIVATKEEDTSSFFFFFFVSSADSAITTLISSCRQVRLGRRTEEETSGIPGHRKPLGVRHSLRDGLRIPRVPLFDSIASYPSAVARSHSRHAYLPLLISSLSISFLVNLSRVSLRLIATPLFLPPTKLLNDFVGWSNTDRWYERR